MLISKRGKHSDKIIINQDKATNYKKFNINKISAIINF